MRSPLSLLPAFLLVIGAFSGPAVAGTPAAPPDAPAVRVTRWAEFGTVTVESFSAGEPAGHAVADAGTAVTTVGLELALGAVFPNPAHGMDFVANLVLPSADPAQLELLDVMGRRVAARDLGALGAGRHSVELDGGVQLAPGVYMLRLTQAGLARVTRVTIVD
jgi:hypothetical protein